MIKELAIIGGDLRLIKLAQMFSLDDKKVFTYGLENTEELKNKNNIIQCNSLNEAVQNSDTIIAPIPFSSNGEDINTPFSNKKITIRELMHSANGRTIIAGAIPSNVFEMQLEEDEECSEIIDVMKKEELAILNTISTAEGTIELMISNTNRVVHGSEVLILGFGRVSKTLADKLQGLSAKVTCAARKQEQLAWIRTYGYQAININNLKSELTNYDFIINTVPEMILDKEKLTFVREDTLIIDLASAPGGIDMEQAKKRGIKAIWALALPGKVAPLTTAEIIKESIYNILEEEN